MSVRSRPTKRIGLFGGAFNPIHVGHLLLAETAREQLSLDRVLFIPTGVPPHKSGSGLLPGQARLRLIRLAIRGNPAFQASDIELQRPGVSYTLETVQAVRARFPKAALFLLIGQDMLGVKWRAWEEIVRLARPVVAGRPGASAPQDGRRVWLNMPPVGIASSDIRSRVAAGRSIRYWVSPAVERAIARHGWYRIPEPLKHR